MAELPERDAALLLDMLLAARDARGFVKGLDGYAEVRLDTVWLVVRDHLDPLIALLEELIPGEDEGRQ
jgi:uncharacterized protein with HEPN domain